VDRGRRTWNSADLRTLHHAACPQDDHLVCHLVCQLVVPLASRQSVGQACQLAYRLGDHQASHSTVDQAWLPACQAASHRCEDAVKGDRSSPDSMALAW